jgi:hypothetical protein
MAHHARESAASPTGAVPGSATTDNSGTTLTSQVSDPSYAQVAADDVLPESPVRPSGPVDGVEDTPIRQQRDSRIPSPAVIASSAMSAHRRRGSTASNLSFDSPKGGRGKGGGIRVGTAKPVGGVVTGTGGRDVTPSSGEEDIRSSKAF